jgi:hypothetical protein
MSTLKQAVALAEQKKSLLNGAPCKRLADRAVTPTSAGAVVAAKNSEGVAEVVTTRAKDRVESAAESFESTAELMLKMLAALSKVEADVSLRTKTCVGRAKDSAGQLGDALSRVTKLLGTDFETRLQQLERTAAALSTLADLQRDGRLESVIRSIGGNGK